ncbi:ABC transporter ATP-binding protein [Bacillus spongiae]|uniref:ABC transporter ATP-binding protein n=1 Tax=Bacillus spongiae TaxID=2683610 RepID=A0ABU8HCW0_9BACI
MIENRHQAKTAFYMWKLITYKRGLYSLSIILSALAGIMPLIDGLIIKSFFDIIGGQSSTNIGISLLVILLLVSTLIRVLIIRFGFIVSTRHDFSITLLLRRNLINSIMKNARAKARVTTAGETINTFRDDVEQVKTTISWLSWMIGQILFAIVALVIMLSINVKITLFSIMPLIGIIILAQVTGRKVEKYRDQSRQASANVNGYIGEIFDSILTIKVSGSTKNVLKRLDQLNRERHSYTVKDSFLFQLLNSINNNAVTLGTGLILLLSGRAIVNGEFSFGDFALFVYYLGFVAESIESTGNFLLYYKQTKVAFKRLSKQLLDKQKKKLVEHKTISLSESSPTKPVQVETLTEAREGLESLKVANLSYQYAESKNGIHNINFTIKAGEVTVICGRTGSGKTTLVRTMLGLLPKNKGHVYWNNQLVKQPELFFIPPQVAYTSQQPNLFSDTIRNNIALGIPDDQLQLEEAIESAVLEQDLMQMENGVDTVVGPKGVKLSGGQLQRVALARMFARKSDLLVLDDVSSALDVKTETAIWERLFSNNNPTAIIVSNSQFALKQADNVLVMKNGYVEAQGKLADVINQSTELNQLMGYVTADQ